MALSCLYVRLSVRSFVCRLQRVLLLAAGGYRIGHSGGTDLLYFHLFVLYFISYLLPDAE